MLGSGGSNPLAGTIWEQVSKEATGSHQTVNLDLFGGTRFDSFRSHQWPTGEIGKRACFRCTFPRGSSPRSATTGPVTESAYVAVSKTASCGFESHQAYHLLVAEQADAAGLNPVVTFGCAGSNPARETRWMRSLIGKAPASKAGGVERSRAGSSPAASANGDMAEWPNASAWKAEGAPVPRRFESCCLRHWNGVPNGKVPGC